MVQKEPEKEDQNKEALKQSKYLLDHVFNTIQDGIIIMDSDFNILRVNAIVERWIGDAELIANRKCYEAVWGRQEICPNCRTLGAMKSESIVKDEQKKVGPDGSVAWAEIYSYPLFDKRKNLIGAIEHVRDITERKLAEEEVFRLRNLLSNIVNSMPSAIIGVDTDKRIMQWNLEAERLTGKTSDQAMGKLFQDVLPQLSDKENMIKQSIRDGNAQIEEKVEMDLCNENYLMNITIYPLKTGQMEGAVIRMDDVTERVRIEEIMIQTEKLMSLGGLAAGMAHEINNPLAGIIQNVQVIRNRMSGKLPKNQKVAQACGTSIDRIEDYMEQRDIFNMMTSVMESGERAAKIVNNMLSFSRKSDTHFIQHDLGELLDKAVVLAESDYDLKKKYDFRQIEIFRKYDPTVPEVVCEASKIQQVFLNILKNGAEAMAQEKDEGKTPKFILRIIPDGKVAQVEIEDSGPGMTEDVRKRVFEPFFTTKEVGVGTGLGLSVSYFIITENHEGTISVDSIPGKGSKFIIRLPFEVDMPGISKPMQRNQIISGS